MSVLLILGRPPQLKFGDATYDKRLEKSSSFVSIILHVVCFPKWLKSGSQSVKEDES